jgi:hypothetical protein
VAAKLKIVKEFIKGTPIIGDSWKLVSIVRHTIYISRNIAQRELERRERKLSGIRRIEAQFFKVI